MEKRKILFISHFFPPTANVQSRINLGTVRAFEEWGFKPIILTGDIVGNYDKTLSNEIRGLEIHKYSLPSSRPLMDKIRGRLKVPVQRNLWSGIQRSIVRKASLILAQNDVQLIYSISSPGDAHRAALEIATRYKLFWIAEFQDPWIENITMDKWAEAYMWPQYWALCKKKAKKELIDVLTRANLILTESDGHCEMLKSIASQKNIDTTKIHRAYLGVHPSITNWKRSTHFSRLLHSNELIFIGFVGRVYYGYEKKVEAFVRFIKTIQERAPHFVFITVGCQSLPKLLRKYGVTGCLCVHEVEYGQALEIMDKLDWGVVIPSSSKNINSKVFEYLAFKTPVLVWGEEQDEMARLVKEKRAGITLSSASNRDILQCVKMLDHKKGDYSLKTEWIMREYCLRSVRNYLPELS